MWEITRAESLQTFLPQGYTWEGLAYPHTLNGNTFPSLLRYIQ